MFMVVTLLDNGINIIRKLQVRDADTFPSDLITSKKGCRKAQT
ncbi:MAG: hypothetical protein Q4A75_09785 [Peptostreptococcaceae bacterium]|nr:hypothetical protein [Peptostreptococcaceae bacterium]